MHKIIEETYQNPWPDRGIMVSKSTWYYNDADGYLYRDIGHGIEKERTTEELVKMYEGIDPQNKEMKAVLKLARNMEINDA